MAVEVLSTNPTIVRQFVHASSTAVVVGTFVQLDGTNGGIKPAADGVEVYGVALESIALGAWGSIAIPPCEVRCQLAGTPDLKPGDVVYCAGTSTVDEGAATNLSIGHVVRTDPAATAGTDVYVMMSPMTRTTHA